MSNEINLPDDRDLAYEPARSIADMFADAKLVKTVIAALAGVLAALLKVTIDVEIVDQLTTIVLFIAPMITYLVANHEQSTLARKQGEKTRDVVYAPATVKRLVDRAVRTGYQAGTPPTAPEPEIIVPLPNAERVVADVQDAT